jgi:hypothetical protein
LLPKEEQLGQINLYTSSKTSYSIDFPCEKQPTEEEFDDCVVCELEEFCDGLLGCAALMVHPIPMLILVAAHCAAC